MSFLNDISDPTLMPDDDLEAGKFLDTYLQNAPKSQNYGTTTYNDFITAKISETTLPELFKLFHSWSSPSTSNIISKDQKEIYDWYLQLHKTMLNKYFLILKRLFGYQKLIDSLNGYKNAKEYLSRALIYNKDLWRDFFDIMGGAASNLKNGMIETDIVRLMELEQSSDQQKTIIIIEYLTSFMEIANNRDWYNHIVDYGTATSNLLDQVENILKRHLNQIIRVLRTFDI